MAGVPMAGGWTDYRTGKHYDGGQTVTTPVDKTFIPVFVRNSAATLFRNNFADAKITSNQLK
jgi:alpha-glucosidase (family GH31 glycosyl hydrolase)